MTFTEFLEVFLTAAAPISELRGAIPLAIAVLDISWPLAFLVAYLGNLFPVPFILLLLDPLSRLLSRIHIFERILNWIFSISRRRGGIIERYGAIGLVLFVAIPLPITGAWTGSIVAFLLGMKFRYAFPAIMLGVFIAGVIVTTLTLLGWAGATIAGIALMALAIIGLRNTWRSSRND
ncbi:MAG: small multi-drug export protein [Chloroflexota bacterium]|nr:small multi-drug export protein [Chloroflexota bacterium]